MNYFLINNGFHITDILEFIGNEPASLIIVPHMMNREIPKNRFDKVITIASPFRSPEKAWMGTFGYFKTRKIVDSEIDISSADTLFVYTEYEILNHYIAYRFKERGAKVILMEEGIAALVTLSKSDKAMRPDWKFSHFWIRNIFALRKSQLTIQSGICMPVIEDDFWDAACIYHGNSTSRNLHHILIQHFQKPALDLIPGCVIFVNQPIYEWYLGFDEYSAILHRCLAGLSKSFDKVFFKFHPRETKENRQRIIEATKDIEFQVIEDSRGVELLYSELRPSHIASFFSTGLLNASDLGIQPIFFHHLIPGAKSSTLFTTIDKLLETLNVRQNLLPEELTPMIKTIPHSKSERLGYNELVAKLGKPDN